MCRCARHKRNTPHWRAAHHWYDHNGTTHIVQCRLDPMRRQRVGWSHLLHVWVYLQRAQPVLFAVRTRHVSDDGASDIDNNPREDCNCDDNDNQHVNTQFGSVQVVLRAELGQLVVQMLVGLLCGMPTMCNNFGDNQQHFHTHGYLDGHVDLRDNSGSHSYHNDVWNKPTHFHHSTAAGLQVLVCRQCKALGEEVHVGKVQWLS